MFLVTMSFDPTRRIGHWYATLWGRIITKLNNRWSFEVIGQERIPQDRPLVVVSNHQGMGDIMMAFCMDLHFKWISKAANFYVPCMGWFMYHAGYIPLRRGDKSSIVKCMARARWYLDHGRDRALLPRGHAQPGWRGQGVQGGRIQAGTRRRRRHSAARHRRHRQRAAQAHLEVLRRSRRRCACSSVTSSRPRE